MRLTLRTLLAYLDDLLKPAEAREIGRRLSESEGAGAMAGRIRDVLRRRRVSAPPVDGQPDANVVAEYLDNLLPDADVENHERACLSSDEALAETAATHQILSLAMGKPVQVSQSLIDRAYALGPEGEFASNDADATPPSHTAGETAEPSPATEPPLVVSGASGRVDVSSFLAKDNERSWTRWAAGALACVVGVIVFAVLFTSDDAFRPTQRTAVVEIERAEADEAAPNAVVEAPEDADPKSNDAVPGGPVAATDISKAAPNAVAVADGNATSDSPSSVAMAKGDTPTQAKQPPTTAAAADPKGVSTDEPAATQPGQDAAATVAMADPKTSEPTEPGSEAAVDGDSVAMSKAAPSSVPAPPEPQPTVIAPPAAPLLEAMEWQQLGEGLALHRDPIIDGWTTLPPRSKLFADERLVIPEPFEASLRTDAGPLAMRFLSNTDVHILPPTSETRGGLEIVDGRAVIESVGDDVNADPVSLVLLLGDRSILATIGSGAELALEVTPTPPDKIRAGQSLITNSVVTVIRGPVGLELIPAGDASKAGGDASNTDAAATGPRVVTVGASLEVAPFEATPDWAIDSEPSTLTRRYGTMYRNLLPDEQPLVPELTAILNEPTYRMSELAAATLSMLGNAPGLVAALGSVHEETRRRSITGLRRWLADDPARIEELAELLSTRYRSETVDDLVEMLAGYSIDDLRRPSVSEDLVSHLEDAEIAVREVAFFDLKGMTGKTFDYQPNANSQSRGVAVRRWRDYVARDGALLTPVIEDEAE